MPAKPFEAHVRQQPGVAIVDMRGDINASAEAALNAAYDEASAQNPEAILLNFRNVEYINSTGIALIVGLLAQSRKARRPLLTCGLSDHYTHLFQITRLADFMQMFPDEAMALAK